MAASQGLRLWSAVMRIVDAADLSNRLETARAVAGSEECRNMSRGAANSDHCRTNI
jgi:hypothetical protein